MQHTHIKFRNISVFFLLFFLLVLPYRLALGETVKQSNSIAWELSNTDSTQQAGKVKANGTALLVVDYQNFCANRKGFLGQLFQDKDHIIDNTKLAVEKARKAGVPIIYINTILDPKLMPNTTLFETLKKKIPWDKLSAKELKWNFDVVDELKPKKEDFVVIKGSWSNGFRDTNLRSIISSLKINTVIITGVAEPIAIYGTFLGAFDEGLETVMLSDCIVASADPKTQQVIHDFSNNTFYPLMGSRVTTSKFLNFN